MAPQSRPLSLLLTRPAAQGDRFAADLVARLPGRVDLISTPLMEPVFLAPDWPEATYSALILTSETGVDAAGRLKQAGRILPKAAWCVGDRTARVARDAGFDATSAQGDAEALIARILGSGDLGPFLHLRGRDARGDIAPRLSAQGRPAQAAIVYAQEERPLATAARDALSGSRPVLVPLFSPRSAALFAQHGPFPAPLWIVSISADAAKAIQPLAPARLAIAERPEAAAMMTAIETMMNDPAS